MQVPPMQFFEQQVVPLVQALPSVLQPPATIGVQVPPAQLPPQHCASEVQAVPSGVHAPAQVPLTHDRPQHCTDEVQATPLARQPPPPVPPLPPVPMAKTQLFDAGSQTPTQQSVSVAQVPPGEMQKPALMSVGPLLLVPVDE